MSISHTPPFLSWHSTSTHSKVSSVQGWSISFPFGQYFTTYASRQCLLSYLATDRCMSRLITVPISLLHVVRSLQLHLINSISSWTLIIASPISNTRIPSMRRQHIVPRSPLVCHSHRTATPPNDAHRLTCSRPHHDTYVPREISASPDIDYDTCDILASLHSYPNLDTTILENPPIHRHPRSNSALDSWDRHAQTLSSNMVHCQR